MFILSDIRDTIPVQPSNFGQSEVDVLTRELNKKYANKVLHEVGLCISVFDIVKCSEGKVRYGDGCLWYQVEFRLAVFKPFVSEVLVGKIKSSTEDGIKISMTFFDDIFIPVAYLPTPSAFDPNEQAFFWRADYPAEATRHEMLDSEKATRLYLDTGEHIRFRVESEEFYDDEPGPPKALEGVRVEASREGKRPPYSIVGSIAEQGLGLLSWWTEMNQDAEEET